MLVGKQSIATSALIIAKADAREPVCRNSCDFARVGAPVAIYCQLYHISGVFARSLYTNKFAACIFTIISDDKNMAP